MRSGYRHLLAFRGAYRHGNNTEACFFCVRPFCRIPGTLTLDMTSPPLPPAPSQPLTPYISPPRQLLVNSGKFGGTRGRLIKGSARLPCEPSRSPGRPPQSASWVIFKVTGLCTSSWPRWAPPPPFRAPRGGGTEYPHSFPLS